MMAIVNPKANIAPPGMPYFSADWLDDGDRYQIEHP